jgi:hypothetical protein
LREIGDPVVAGAPAGVRIRTRIHPTVAEAEALAAVGELLGSVYRRELAGRVGLGRLDHKAHAVWRAKRKQGLTAVSSSRWAGAITRAVEDQYQLGMRGLAARVADLRAAVQVLEARCVLRPGELAAVEDTDTRQDPAPDSGRVRAHHRPDPTTNRAPHHDGAVVPAHPHPHEERGSTGEHPPPAANTVRAAQDPLLISN